MEHECIHEPDFAVMQKDIGEIKNCQFKILKILQGDNSEGVTTRVALLRQSVGRIWFWIGGISLFMLGILAYVIKSI
jgi:hypothetical protein